MTVIHKPEDEHETARIENADGFVARGRVNGFLAVCRAMGNLSLKNSDLPQDKQKVIALSDISSDKLDTGDFVFMSCDGFFEVFTEEDIGAYLREHMPNMETGDLLEKLLNETIERGSKDNLTAVIIELVDGADYGTDPVYIPGEFFQKGNSTYAKAYTEFAQMCGYSLEQSMELLEEMQRSEPK
eukprot:TRINITY_DN3628_c0_g1_i2.p1 TRINITY_DN3628_c0_g1~~TRINITY_DN3628_c0_g1_i2.p1  ORF type:complete len:185 (-),score=46.95 TRINITY_DN3628_c0_g1_i2:66-620(-)